MYRTLSHNLEVVNVNNLRLAAAWAARHIPRNPNRYHLASMDIWHTGGLTGTGDGWIGRYVDAQCCGYGKGESGRPDGSMDGKGEPPIAIGNEAPLMLSGRSMMPVSFESADLFAWAGKKYSEDIVEKPDPRARRAGEGQQQRFPAPHRDGCAGVIGHHPPNRPQQPRGAAAHDRRNDPRRTQELRVARELRYPRQPATTACSGSSPAHGLGMSLCKIAIPSNYKPKEAPGHWWQQCHIACLDFVGLHSYASTQTLNFVFCFVLIHIPVALPVPLCQVYCTLCKAFKSDSSNIFFE